MNEAQTRFNKIDPKLRDAGWGIVPGSKILVEQSECTAEPTSAQRRSSLLALLAKNRPYCAHRWRNNRCENLNISEL